MSRVIKFRGWDATGQKGWVYGDLVHNQKVTKEGLEPRVMVGGYEVIPESVGQFTGCYDSDKNRVYEGDIVRFEHDNDILANGGPVEQEVKYDDEIGGFVVWKGDYCVSLGSEMRFASRFVIGNVYERNKNDNSV